MRGSKRITAPSTVLAERLRDEAMAPEIVSRLGAPLFVEMSPGGVRASCKGFVASGPDRASALRALVDQLERDASL